MSGGVYIGSDGVEHALSDLLGKGTFCVKYNRRETAVRLAFTGLIFAYPALVAIGLVFSLIAFTGIEFFGAVRDFIESIIIIADLGLVGDILKIALCVVGGILLFKTYVRGKECQYRANYEEFTVFDKKNTEHIYYSEVVEVNYKPRQIWKKYEHGYDVEIVAKYRTIVIRYVFPRFNELVNPENTPFELIERQIKK